MSLPLRTPGYRFNESWPRHQLRCCMFQGTIISRLVEGKYGCISQNQISSLGSHLGNHRPLLSLLDHLTPHSSTPVRGKTHGVVNMRTLTSVHPHSTPMWCTDAWEHHADFTSYQKSILPLSCYCTIHSPLHRPTTSKFVSPGRGLPRQHSAASSTICDLLLPFRLDCAPTNPCQQRKSMDLIRPADAVSLIGALTCSASRTIVSILEAFFESCLFRPIVGDCAARALTQRYKKSTGQSFSILRFLSRSLCHPATARRPPKIVSNGLFRRVSRTTFYVSPSIVWRWSSVPQLQRSL